MNRLLLFVTILFSFILLTACNSSDTASDNTPVNVDIKAPAAAKKEQHGMLMAPVFDDSLTELHNKDLQLNPRIETTGYRGGRFFHPVFINEQTFAVASLRGCDIFSVPHPDTHEPTLVPQIQMDTPGHAWSIENMGKTLWIADGYNGVLSIDPETGSVVNHFPELSNARSFHKISNQSVIVCRHSSGADIVTSQDGCSIKERLKLEVSHRVFSATSNEEYIYLGTLGGGYICYKRDEEGLFERLWTYSECQRVLWCGIKGDYHLLIDRDKGLCILRSQNHGLPEQVKLLKKPGQWRHGCLVDQNTLLVAHQSGFMKIDITNPESSTISEFLKSPLDSRGVAAMDRFAVVTDSEYGLRLLKNHQETYEELARYSHDGLVADVCLESDQIYLAHTHRGIVRFSGQNDVETYNDGFYHTAVDMQGDILATADYKGAALYSAVPGKPLIQLARIETPGRAVNVSLHQNLLLVSDWFEGLRIFDISQPEKPLFLSQVKTTGWTIDAVMSNDVAYVCCVNQGLVTVNLSDPANPVVSNVDSSAQAPEGCALGHNCLYLADFNFGLLVYDLTDPFAPTARSCWKMSVCKGVQVRDNTLLLCNYIYGLKWFDISEPMTPVFIGEVDTWGKSYEAVFVPNENAAYIADWHDLLKVTW